MEKMHSARDCHRPTAQRRCSFDSSSVSNADYVYVGFRHLDFGPVGDASHCSANIQLSSSTAIAVTDRNRRVKRKE